MKTVISNEDQEELLAIIRQLEDSIDVSHPGEKISNAIQRLWNVLLPDDSNKPLNPRAQTVTVVHWNDKNFSFEEATSVYATRELAIKVTAERIRCNGDIDNPSKNDAVLVEQQNESGCWVDIEDMIVVTK